MHTDTHPAGHRHGIDTTHPGSGSQEHGVPEPEAPSLPAGAVPLPGGAWVVLRDYRLMDGGDVVDILSTIGGATIGENSARMRMAILGKLITNWSFGHLPLPATEQTLRMLPAAALLGMFALIRPAYDLINGTSVRPVMSAETMQDPASPSPGSSE